MGMHNNNNTNNDNSKTTTKSFHMQEITRSIMPNVIYSGIFQWVVYLFPSFKTAEALEIHIK